MRVPMMMIMIAGRSKLRGEEREEEGKEKMMLRRK